MQGSTKKGSAKSGAKEWSRKGRKADDRRNKKRLKRAAIKESREG